MKSIRRAFPTYSAAEVRTELAQLINAEFGGGTAGKINKVYDYRTAPNRLQIEASITQTSSMPMSGGPFNNGPFYDYTLDLRVRHDNSQEGLRNAEVALGNLAEGIWKYLSEAEAVTFKHVTPFLPDAFPGAPADMADIRIGFLFIRTTPN